MSKKSTARQAAVLRPQPTGWPIGSFRSYEDAQAAVDLLSDKEFDVSHVTIVGVDLMEVERVTGRLTWGRVLGGGALSGVWLGIFIGLIFGLLGGEFLFPLVYGVVLGTVFGIIMAAVPYALSNGRRDFTSQTQIVASRYDVLSDPTYAPAARDIIASSRLVSSYPSNPAAHEPDAGLRSAENREG